jgi:glyoxylase-like metal-dependent hydrolase (beta-lactamase superfamily II)
MPIASGESRMQELQFGPVRFIPGENDGKYPYCHSLLVDGAGVLIDPASDRNRLRALQEKNAVREIWLSHWHEDHIAHLDLFENLPLRIHPDDAPPLSDIERFLDAYDIDNDEYRRYWADLMVKQFHFKPRQPEGYLAGGQIIDLGGESVEVIHTPGHTPGHCAFFFREAGVLFMGDYDLSRFGPWYGDRDSSIEDTIASINRLQSVPARTWLTCHEDGVFETEPGDIWIDYLSVIDEREARLLELLKTPHTMAEIVKTWIVYRKPREPEAFFAFAEEALMRKHITRLISTGDVMEMDEAYVRV